MNLCFYGVDIFDVFYVRMVTDRFKCIQNSGWTCLSLPSNIFTIPITITLGQLCWVELHQSLKTATEMFQPNSKPIVHCEESKFIHFTDCSCVKPCEQKINLVLIILGLLVANRQEFLCRVVFNCHELFLISLSSLQLYCIHFLMFI